MIATMAKRSSKEPANNKLAQLKARHFTSEGRKERIAKALQLLYKPVPGCTGPRNLEVGSRGVGSRKPLTWP